MRVALVLFVALVFAPGSGWAQEVALSPHHTFRSPGEPVALTFSDGGEILVAGATNGRVDGWTVEDQQKIVQLRLQSEIRFLGFLSGDSTLVAVDQEGAVSLASVRKRPSQQRRVPEVRFRLEGEPQAVAMDAGRRYLAVATDAETIGLFDLQAGMRMGRIDAGDAIDDLLFLGFDRLGRQLAAITRQGTVMTWNPKTQRQIRKLTLRGGDLHGSRSVIHAAATRRASSVFVVGLQEVTLPTGGARRRARPGDLVRQNRIIAYDWNTGLEVKRVEYPDGPPRHLVLGPGTNHVVAIPDEDPRLNLVHLERGEIVSSVPVDGTPTALTLSEDDQWLGAGTEEGHVVVWTIQRRGPPEASDQEADLPSLSGRIRVLSKKTPAIPADTSADLAVLPFQSRGDSTQIADMCSNVLTSQLASAEHLTLLERERIDEILSELQLQASDLTQSDGARIGRLLNADYLILGSLNVVDTTYLFNARLLRVETSEITAGRRVICEECEGKDIFDALHLLGTTIAE